MLDCLRDLANPSMKSMSVGGDHISVRRGEVKEFPANVIMAPRSGGGVDDGFDITAAAKVINIVSGNQALQSLYLSTVSDRRTAGTEGVRFQMEAGDFDDGFPSVEGEKILEAARNSAS